MRRADSRGWGSGWPNCQPNKMVRVTAGGVTVQVRQEVAAMVEYALRKTAETGYRMKQAQTGAFVCRPIGGTRTPSNHSWGLAIDINWNENPFTRDRNAKKTITPAVVKVWKSIGWSWGGDWSGKKDYMHFEFNGTPEDAARITRAVVQEKPLDPPPVGSGKKCGDPVGHPLLKKGAKNRAVNHAQYLLQKTGARIIGDGDFGDKTYRAVVDYQKSVNLWADGQVGPLTWAALHKSVDGLSL